ncbi:MULTISPECIES: hypothetical protein [unclassified Streptosporangium]|nr:MULTISPECIES: hypothetical protein [unclassified Streptosporangium]
MRRPRDVTPASGARRRRARSAARRRRAHELGETGRTTGKIVLTVAR